LVLLVRFYFHFLVCTVHLLLHCERQRPLPLNGLAVLQLLARNKNILDDSSWLCTSALVKGDTMASMKHPSLHIRACETLQWGVGFRKFRNTWMLDTMP
jgi:hypothetical protein